MGKQPSRDDPSKPKAHGYAYKKQFYQSADVAADYDEHRFRTPKRQRRNARKWAAIQRALALTNGVKTIVDLPCGTGRFTGALDREGYEIVGSDISNEMLVKAASIPDGQQQAISGYVQANAEHLPLRNDSLDCVVSIRFMMHVDPETRVRMLREFHRVSRRWVIIDYRHCYTIRYVLTQTLGRLGIGRTPLSRVSRKELDQEFNAAGFAIRKVIRVSAPLLSDKWIVLAERA